MRDTRQRGTSVALSSVVCLVSFAFMGCFITTDIDVPEPPLCPPVIQSSPTGATPIEQIVRIDRTASETTFDVVIRDCNQRQPIETLAMLNYRPPSPILPIFRRVRITDRDPVDPELANFQFVLAHQDLIENACNKVELRASGQFDFIAQIDPVIEGDLDTVVWWVLYDDADPVTEVPLSSCQ
jgi:hypothetical protein